MSMQARTGREHDEKWEGRRAVKLSRLGGTKSKWQDGNSDASMAREMVVLLALPVWKKLANAVFHCMRAGQLGSCEGDSEDGCDVGGGGFMRPSQGGLNYPSKLLIGCAGHL